MRPKLPLDFGETLELASKIAAYPDQNWPGREFLLKEQRNFSSWLSGKVEAAADSDRQRAMTQLMDGRLHTGLNILLCNVLPNKTREYSRRLQQPMVREALAPGSVIFDLGHYWYEQAALYLTGVPYGGGTAAPLVHGYADLHKRQDNPLLGAQPWLLMLARTFRLALAQLKLRDVKKIDARLLALYTSEQSAAVLAVADYLDG